MATDPEIRASGPDDLTVAIALLEEAALPVSDLHGAKFDNFLVATVDGAIAGFVGLEQFGRLGLLRSLLVTPDHRDAGLGRRLVAAIESRAADAGVREMWLLTIDADGWFTNLGYTPCDRSEAPRPIASTEEFTSLCPGSAVLMKKPL